MFSNRSAPQAKIFHRKVFWLENDDFFYFAKKIGFKSLKTLQQNKKLHKKCDIFGGFPDPHGGGFQHVPNENDIPFLHNFTCFERK